MSTLVRSESDYDLTKYDLDSLLQKIVTAIGPRAESIYVFGSAATREFTRHSDIDLIIVCSTNHPFVERPKLFADLYSIYPNLDLLVYTQEELERQLADSSVGFWKSVRLSMKKLK